MNYVDKIEIEGFWGTQKVSLDLRDDLNILIGPNGSGKTLIISLISAALRADVITLYAIQFEKITIRLKAMDGSRNPVIEVEKIDDEEMGSVDLRYTIREKDGGKGKTYGVGSPNDGRIYRVDSRRRGRSKENGSHLSDILAKYVEVNWLSIHRTALESDNSHQYSPPFDSPVDRKLRELSKDFSSYFSLLASKADTEYKKFLRRLIESLKGPAFIDDKDITDNLTKDMDFASNVVALMELIESKPDALSNIDYHPPDLDIAKGKTQEENEAGSVESVSTSIEVSLTELLEEWRHLQKKLTEVFQPKTQFEQIINNLFSEKTVRFDDRNIPRVHLEGGEDVDIDVLSSGEKQLLILLGEALLQEQRPVVFISDEPEMSLHVDWQSSLFENVRKLNSACQIISATHSPDIVGPFQEHIIKVKDYIKNDHQD